MSDRIDEYHGADDTAYTTAEVESWFDCSIRVEHGKLLATTRALEKLEEGLRLWHGLGPDERAMLAIEHAGKMWRQAVAERDEARSEVARRDALISSDGYEDMRQHAVDLAQRLETAERERAAALVERDDAQLTRSRVAELETALLDACREKVLHGHTTTLLVTAEKLKVPGIKKLCINADQIRSESKTLVSEAQTRVAALEAALDDALHTHRCVEETEQYREVLVRVEKAERDLRWRIEDERSGLVLKRDTARFDRDAARTLIAELAAALEVLGRFAGKVGRDDLCEQASAALAKAKEAANGSR